MGRNLEVIRGGGYKGGVCGKGENQDEDRIGKWRGVKLR